MGVRSQAQGCVSLFSSLFQISREPLFGSNVFVVWRRYCFLRLLEESTYFLHNVRVYFHCLLTGRSVRPECLIFEGSLTAFYSITYAGTCYVPAAMTILLDRRRSAMAVFTLESLVLGGVSLVRNDEQTANLRQGASYKTLTQTPEMSSISLLTPAFGSWLGAKPDQARLADMVQHHVGALAAGIGRSHNRTGLRNNATSRINRSTRVRISSLASCFRQISAQPTISETSFTRRFQTKSERSLRATGYTGSLGVASRSNDLKLPAAASRGIR